MNNRIIRTALALFFVAVITTAPRAQQPAPVLAKQSPEDRIALYQALLDLTNPWTVMCIAAHPDDEDGTSLIVMRRKYGAHTVSLFSTFGEGGQNAIGPELYEELGAIRARETMAAAEIQGSEPHFLGLKDFGYSKSADEAFKFWGHEEALRRMVLEIRKLRPDVIITNHSATSNDHGHHQATARLELEAFDAAADPTKFPEQLKDGVTVWQVQRLFVRARGNAAQNTNPQGTAEQLVTIDPNERDPVRGTVFAEEALRALQKHATQGPWPKTLAQMAARFANSPDGRLPLVRYRLVREAKGAEALTKDSHNFLDGLRLSDSLANEFRLPTIEGRPLLDFTDQRDRVLAVLIESAKKARLLGPIDAIDYHRLKARTGHFSQALAIAAALSTKLIPSRNPVEPKSEFSFTVELTNHGARELALGRLNVTAEGPSTASPVALLNTSLAPGKTFSCPIHMAAGVLEPSLPHETHLYDGRFWGYAFAGYVVVEIEKVSFEVKAEASVDVAPGIEIAAISPSPIIRTPAATKRTMTGAVDCVFRDFDFTVRVTNNQDSPFSGDIVTGPLSGRKAGSSVMVAAHKSANVTLIVPACSQSSGSAKASLTKADPITFSVLAKTGSALARLEVPVVWADAGVAPNLRIGYVRGFDFSLPNALAALGVESKELSVDEVKTADLQKYTSIIVDNRVYESQPELIAANQKLLDYANAGGTLIVFYHKSDEWNPDERRKRPQLAPYKLILGNERITDETAPITFIEPEHPLLNSPNKMGQEDFANWIQERGLYYPKDWDPQYHALLQSNDPGEAPLKGGLLVADYGRGHYIYTSMVWYRELRGGVPGAYRMLANMISYGEAEGKSKK